MLFNSYEFILIYLPFTVIFFYLTARFIGNGVAIGFLTASSLFFYGWWDLRYVPLLVCSIVFNYFGGYMIETARAHKTKKVFLTIGALVDILLLGYFKYTSFFVVNINSVFGTDFFIPEIVLPLGISFFTFTQMAYLIDVYRGTARSHGIVPYSLFVTIFPHLIAGPIINYRSMMPQFLKAAHFSVDWHKMAFGLTLFSMGLFKKVVVADNIAPFADSVFANAENISLIEAWIGALCYTLQLYFDFSGYSEMAVALGLMIGFELPVNFDSPYQARSMIDFWRRWHMTLGVWVRDYLYIPMGGNRSGEFMKMRNLIVSMFIIGLWHGAGWTFVLWGGLHGVFLVINHAWRKWSSEHNISLPGVMCHILTFLCVTSLWVIFRADTFADGIAVLHAMFDVSNVTLPAGGVLEHNLGFLSSYGVDFTAWDIRAIVRKNVIVFIVIFIAVMTARNPIRFLKEIKMNKYKMIALFIISIYLLVYSIEQLNDYTAFLYFQF